MDTSWERSYKETKAVRLGVYMLETWDGILVLDPWNAMYLKKKYYT